MTILKKPEDKRTDAEKKELYDWWLGSFDQPYQQSSRKLTELAKQEGLLRVRGTVAYVMQERPTPPRRMFSIAASTTSARSSHAGHAEIPAADAARAAAQPTRLRQMAAAPRKTR